jgi:glycerol-3-phosphate dehydrogenase
MLKPHLPALAGGDWTADAPLPGGDFAMDGIGALVAALGRDFPFLDAATVARGARAYGTQARDWLGDARRAADLGADFGHGLTRAEVDYLVAREWAQSADDILWRRTKLGLRFDAGQRARLEAYLEEAGCVAT